MMWLEHYKPQSLISIHDTIECARSSLLADQVSEFRQAHLELQARQEGSRWHRRQRRRLRYVGSKLKTRPAEALEQLQGFGEGVDFLEDAFAGLVADVRTYGYLPPHPTLMGLQVCGSTQEPASIGRNPLAYTLLINNLGCTPGVSAADIDPWLEPIRRPAELRDQPRHALIGADPDECRIRLLKTLEAERNRYHALAERVREEFDVPSLVEALNRVAILSEESARRAARSHTSARVAFHQASKALVKSLERDEEKGVGSLSTVPGPLPAGSDAVAEPPAEAGPRGEGTGPADVDQGPTNSPGAGPMPAERREDGLFSWKPENGIDATTPDQYKTVTYVDARVSDEGCAKMRQTGAQPAPEAAQTGANASAAAGPDQTPGADLEAGPAGTQEPVRRLTDWVPLSACRREGSLLTSDPEKEAAALDPRVEQATGYASLSVSGAEGAKPEG